jgi:hypothetical protein
MFNFLGGIMYKKLAFIFFFFVFTTEAFSMNGAEDDKEHAFPYHLMRAVDSEDNSALFVPTQHDYPWEILPKWFKEQILSKNVGLFESCEEVEAEEVLRRFSKESLPAEVFLSEEESWTARYGHDIFQELYSQIAQHMQKKGFDYSYLNNISTVCPGFLAYLNVYFVNGNSDEEALAEGMDFSIQSLFKQQGKRVVSLEKRNSQNIKDTDDWKSYSITTASYDEVIADFQNQKIEAFIRRLEGFKEEKKEEELIKDTIETKRTRHLASLPSFREVIRDLELRFYKDNEYPSIFCFNNADGKRNRLWMLTILREMVKNKEAAENKAVIAVGAAHFVGPEGILSLGQEAGLRWQYYNNERGGWEDFTYKPGPSPEKKRCLIS